MTLTGHNTTTWVLPGWVAEDAPPEMPSVEWRRKNIKAVRIKGFCPDPTDPIDIEFAFSEARNEYERERVWQMAKARGFDHSSIRQMIADSRNKWAGRRTA